MNIHKPEDLPAAWLAASIVSLDISNVSAKRADQLVTKYLAGEETFYSEFATACYDNDLEDLFWDARDWWMAKSASEKNRILRNYMNWHRKVAQAEQDPDADATVTSMTLSMGI